MKRPPKRRDIPTDFHAETEAEALFLEQAQAFFRDLQKAAGNAPNGQVINQVESAILPTSKKLVQRAMQLTLQEQVDDLEKKTKRRAAKPVKRKKDIEDIDTKTS